MKKGIVGKKIGMTQIFTEDGRLIPVTVIQAGPSALRRSPHDLYGREGNHRHREQC